MWGTDQSASLELMNECYGEMLPKEIDFRRWKRNFLKMRRLNFISKILVILLIKYLLLFQLEKFKKGKKKISY